jgi:hypothetical protein
MTVASELGSLTQQTTTEPGTVTLSLVSDDLNIETARLGTATTSLTGLDTGINQMSDITLQSTAEVLVEGRTTRQHNVLVKTSSDINW